MNVRQETLLSEGMSLARARLCATVFSREKPFSSRAETPNYHRRDFYAHPCAKNPMKGDDHPHQPHLLQQSSSSPLLSLHHQCV